LDWLKFFYNFKNVEHKKVLSTLPMQALRKKNLLQVLETAYGKKRMPDMPWMYSQQENAVHQVQIDNIPFHVSLLLPGVLDQVQ
jgi:hypothetical protein